MCFAVCTGLTLPVVMNPKGLKGPALVYIANCNIWVFQLFYERTKVYVKKAAMNRRSYCKVFPIILTCLLLFPVNAPAKGPLDFSLKNIINGKEYKLSNYREKINILVFGSIYCKPCIELVPVLNKLYDLYKSSDVLIAGVDIDKTTDMSVLQNFVKKMNIHFPFLIDQGEIKRQNKVHVLPTILFVDINGETLKRYQGFQSYNVLEKEIKKLKADQNIFSRDPMPVDLSRAAADMPSPGMSEYAATVFHDLEPVVLHNNIKGEIHITLILAPDKKLIGGHMAQYSIKLPRDSPLNVSRNYIDGEIKSNQLEIPFTTGTSGEGITEIHAAYAYCTKKDRLCIPRNIVWRIPIKVVPSGDESFEVIDIMDRP